MDQQTPEAFSVFSMRLFRLLTWFVLWYALIQRSLPLTAASGGTLLISYAALLWSRFALRKLEAELVPDGSRLFPDDPCPVTLVLKNRKLLPIWVQLQLSSHAHVAMDHPHSIRTSLFSGEVLTLTRKLHPRKRGIYPLGSAGVSAGDMLGLHSKTSTFAFPRELIVYPRMREAVYPTLEFQEFFGAAVSRCLVEDPCWYAGTREYTGTRPAKSINWKASARLGELQEKIFDPTSHRKILMVLDVRGFAEHQGSCDGSFVSSSEDFEELIEAAAALASVLAQNGSSFSLAVNAALKGSLHPALPVGNGPEHLGMLLELLARVQTVHQREISPLVALPEFRGAGIVYFGSAPEKAREIPWGRNAPLLYICTQAPVRSGHPWYQSREVIR